MARVNQRCAGFTMPEGKGSLSTPEHDICRRCLEPRSEHPAELRQPGINRPPAATDGLTEEQLRKVAVEAADEAVARHDTLGKREAEHAIRSHVYADQLQTMRDENTALLAENARLRRQIETMERRAKR